MSTEDKSRKTEPATPRKLRDARNKGRVAKSRELTSSAVVIAAIVYFYLQWHAMVERFEEMTIISTTLFDYTFSDALKRMLDLLTASVYEIALPFMLTLVVAGVAAHIVQFGVLLSWDPVTPRAERLSPATGIKRIASVHNLLETLKAAFKTLSIVGIVAAVLYLNAEDLLRIPYCDIECERRMLEHIAGRIALYLVPFIVLLAILDYVLQRHHFLVEHRMSREELKRETRESQGAPELRGRRRDERHELASSGGVAAAGDATVLLLGDDLAVGLYYNREETPIPVVSLIVRGESAAMAAATALGHQVPVEDSPELAHKLAHDAQEGDYIPAQCLGAVAQVLSGLAVRGGT